MSQRSTTQLLQAKALHPILQAALGSLNVQLDEELARYRRQRRGYAGVAHRSSARTPGRKQLDLIAVKAVGGRTQPTAGATQTLERPVAAPPNRPQPPAKPVAPAPTTRTAEVAASTSNLALADHWAEPAATPTAASFQSALAATAETGHDPYDYLESSEDLLRSLSEQEGEVVVQRGFWGYLATPLGVGSLLLLLTSSTLLGYILVNPNSVANLRLNLPGSSQSSNPTASSPASPTPAVLPNSPNLANKEFVDLNLNTLTTLKTDPKPVLPGPARLPGAGAGAKLPTIPITASPTAKPATSTTASKPGTTQTPSAGSAVPPVQPLPPASVSAPLPPVTVSATPQPRREPQLPPVPPTSARRPPAPPVSRPAPAPAPARQQRPQPAPVSAPGPTNYYYVVTPYSGDRALEQARQAVPDAYLVNEKDGAYIRMGTLSDAARAREMVQKLQQQGIPAQVKR